MELIKVEKDNTGISMTTIEIAKLTNKRHDNVMRDTKEMLVELYGKTSLLKFEESYTASNGQSYKCYDLPKVELLVLISGYSAQLRRKIILRLEKLESAPKEMSTMELLQIAMDSEKKRIALEKENKKLLPKAESFDVFMDAEGNYGLREAFKILGLPPTKSTKVLREQKILYYLHKNNVPMQKYLESGLFIVKSICNENMDKTFSQTFVTPKGLDWLRQRFIPQKELVLV